MANERRAKLEANGLPNINLEITQSNFNEEIGFDDVAAGEENHLFSKKQILKALFAKYPQKTAFYKNKYKIELFSPTFQTVIHCTVTLKNDIVYSQSYQSQVRKPTIIFKPVMVNGKRTMKPHLKYIAESDISNQARSQNPNEARFCVVAAEENGKEIDVMKGEGLSSGASSAVFPMVGVLDGNCSLRTDKSQILKLTKFDNIKTKQGSTIDLSPEERAEKLARIKKESKALFQTGRHMKSKSLVIDHEQTSGFVAQKRGFMDLRKFIDKYITNGNPPLSIDDRYKLNINFYRRLKEQLHDNGIASLDVKPLNALINPQTLEIDHMDLDQSKAIISETLHADFDSTESYAPPEISDALHKLKDGRVHDIPLLDERTDNASAALSARQFWDYVNMEKYNKYGIDPKYLTMIKEQRMGKLHTEGMFSECGSGKTEIDHEDGEFDDDLARLQKGAEFDAEIAAEKNSDELTQDEQDAIVANIRNLTKKNQNDRTDMLTSIIDLQIQRISHRNGGLSPDQKIKVTKAINHGEALRENLKSITKSEEYVFENLQSLMDELKSKKAPADEQYLKSVNTIAADVVANKHLPPSVSKLNQKLKQDQQLYDENLYQRANQINDQLLEISKMYEGLTKKNQLISDDLSQELQNIITKANKVIKELEKQLNKKVGVARVRSEILTQLDSVVDQPIYITAFVDAVGITWLEGLDSKEKIHNKVEQVITQVQESVKLLEEILKNLPKAQDPELAAIRNELVKDVEDFIYKERSIDDLGALAKNPKLGIFTQRCNIFSMAVSSIEEANSRINNLANKPNFAQASQQVVRDRDDIKHNLIDYYKSYQENKFQSDMLTKLNKTMTTYLSGTKESLAFNFKKIEQLLTDDKHELASNLKKIDNLGDKKKFLEDYLTKEIAAINHSSELNKIYVELKTHQNVLKQERGSFMRLFQSHGTTSTWGRIVKALQEKAFEIANKKQFAFAENSEEHKLFQNILNEKTQRFELFNDIRDAFNYKHGEYLAKQSQKQDEEHGFVFRA